MHHLEMIEASAIAAILTDPRLPDNPIIACNQPFITLTGYGRDEIIGRNCRFLAGKDTDPTATSIIRKGIAQCQPVMTEILNYRKDGKPFRNAVMIVPIFDSDGALEYFLGSQVEVADAGANTLLERRQIARLKVEALSLRQQEILRELAAGKRNKQIAHKLGLSERTVKMHRASMLAALNLGTTADAIRLAIEAGY